MTSKRLKRPVLERDRPIRTWSTLFRAPPDGRLEAGQAPAFDPARVVGPFATPPLGGTGPGGVVSDAVEVGYRVVNEYMRVGQAAAQGFSPSAWTNAAQAGSPADTQQLAQRVMQAGWDFAGMWFEMWTKMAGSPGGWPTPTPGFASGPSPGPGSHGGSPPPPAPGPSGPEAATSTARLAVTVVCERRTATSLELRPGPAATLVVHALRPEGHSAPPITNVTIESSGGGREAVEVKVVVDASQPAGVYNGILVDTTSNLPRGTLSVRIYGNGES